MRMTLLSFTLLSSAILPPIDAQWQNLSDPNLGNIIYCKFISPTNGWIVNLSNTSPQGLLHTTNGGETWTCILNHPPGIFNWINGFDFANASLGYSTALRGRHCFRTLDGGGTWDSVGCPAVVYDRPYIGILSPSRAYYGGGVAFSRSIDTLKTWQIISILPQATIEEPSFRFHFLSEDTIVACGGVPTLLIGEWTGTIECYKSADGGMTWGFPYVDTLAISYASAFTRNRIGYAFSDLADTILDPHYKTHKTTDGGSTWFQIPARVDSGYMQVTDAYFKNPDEGFVCGGKVAHSADGGLTWRTIPGVTGSYMSWADSLHGWVVGSGGTVFRTTTGGVTWIDEKGKARPVQYTLSQNYPNPFNPSTRISFELPVSGSVSLRIYDLLGREVAMVLDEAKEAGYYDVTFDASALASGVYFYKLRAGQFVAVRKMLVAK